MYPLMGPRDTTSLSIEEKMKMRIGEHATKLSEAIEAGVFTSSTQEKKELKDGLNARRKAKFNAQTCRSRGVMTELGQLLRYAVGSDDPV